jgi:hypothetical protein
MDQLSDLAEKYHSDEFKNNSQMKAKLNEMGSDMSLMMKRQMEGNLNSWAIHFCFHQLVCFAFATFYSIDRPSRYGQFDCCFLSGAG